MNNALLRQVLANRSFHATIEARRITAKTFSTHPTESMTPNTNEIIQGGSAVQPEPQSDVADSKRFRRDLDEVLTRLKNASGFAFVGSVQSFPKPRSSRERSLAITKLQEAIMWLGMDLKAINEETPGAAENPYPNSYNPASPVIDPTADGLKL